MIESSKTSIWGGIFDIVAPDFNRINVVTKALNVPWLYLPQNSCAMLCCCGLCVFSYQEAAVLSSIN